MAADALAVLRRTGSRARPHVIAMVQLRALSGCNLTSRLGDLGDVPMLAVSGDEDRIAAHALTIQRASEMNELLVEHFDRS